MPGRPMDGTARQCSKAAPSLSTSSYDDAGREQGLVQATENYIRCVNLSQHAPCNSSMTTPPHTGQHAYAGSQSLLDYVDTEEHERVVRENLRLSKELDEAKGEASKAKREAELAKRAFRMLAEWAYNERKRLPKEVLEGTNGFDTSTME
jgi:hypothetical protein